MKPKLYIVDGHNLIYRMFYAVSDLHAPDGMPVGAVFGTAKTFLGWHQFEKPDYLVVALDAPGGSWRDEVFAEYKGQREETPTDLRSQEGLIFDFMKAAGVRFIQKPGWEADDVIGTLATKFGKTGLTDVYIISSDKDLYTFVGESVAVYDPLKRKVARRAEAIEKFGVPPEYVPDSSDNIPGVTGIGPKGAAELINSIGGVEAIYGALGQEGRVPEKYAKKLRASEKDAWLSKKLATIDVHVPMEDFKLEDFRYAGRDPFTPETVELLNRLGFRSLLPKDRFVDDSQGIFKEDLKISHVVTADLLPELLEKIEAAGTVGISTWGEGIDLAGANFALPDGTVWQVDCRTVDARAFFDTLLPSDAVWKGWEAKNDLRRIRFYLENRT
jgi:DNA polymerase-1